MRKRYRVVFRSVDGKEVGELSKYTSLRYFTQRGADRALAKFLRTSPIPEPIPGRPLFTAQVEPMPK